MKTFLKVFTITFMSCVLLFNCAIWGFNKIMKENFTDVDPDVVLAEEGEEHFNQEEQPEITDELTKLVAKSNRINIVVMGLEGSRSDTMMFVSFDPDSKNIDIISIPRDTYYPRKGYTIGQGKKRINAVYGDHGSKGVKIAISDVLYDIPVHHYITVDYKGAAEIIDSIGGVPVHIPELMDYKDPYDDPPLRIYFEPGDYLLNGEDGVKFLRYRQATPGSGGVTYAGDIGRIQAQQKFIKSAIKRALSFRLPMVVNTAFKHVKTDMELQDVVRYAAIATGLDMDNVSMHVLPGEPTYIRGSSYYLHDPQKVRELLIQIYSNSESVEGDKNNTNNNN